MKLEGVIHCEGPDCEVQQRVGVPNMNAGRLPVGWLRVTEYGDAGPSDLGFHGWDCVLRYAGRFEPEQIIGADE